MHRLSASIFASFVLFSGIAAAEGPKPTPPASTAPTVVADPAESWVCLPAQDYSFTQCDKMCMSSEEQLRACKESERRKKPTVTRFRIDDSSWRSATKGRRTCVAVPTGKRVRVALEGHATFSIVPSASCATHEYRVQVAPCGWTAECAPKVDANALR